MKTAEMNEQLIAHSEAAKLTRKRRRLAKEFTNVCRRIRAIDCRLVRAEHNCSAGARDLFRAEITVQDAKMLEAVAKEGPAPFAAKALTASSAKPAILQYQSHPSHQSQVPA